MLAYFLAPAHESVIGDLDEEFQDDVQWYGARRAGLRYWAHVLWAIPSIRFHDLIWNSIMFKNYVLIALRNLRKYKAFSAINILGLAVSMSVCLLIITVARDQMSYDRFHENSDRIYRVTSQVTGAFGTFGVATSPGPLGPALLTESPGIAEVVRLTRMGGPATFGEQTHALAGLYAEPTFFEVFDFHLLRGDAKTALTMPYSIVLTDAMAAAFFGDQDPMGQVLHRDGLGDFTVTGILAKHDHKTHLVFDALASFATLPLFTESTVARNLDDWGNASTFYNYLLLDAEASPDDVLAVSRNLIMRQHTQATEVSPELDLQALTTIALGDELANQIAPVMPRTSLIFFGVFALVLMLTAIFNYISLTAARSLKRAREIGIRKVVGAQRRQIVQQFLSEAIIIAVLACLLASVLLVWLVPAFNGLSGFQEDLDLRNISLDTMQHMGLYVSFLLFAIGLGVVAGLYPAYKLAAYAPSLVLQGVTAAKGFARVAMRKVLIVFQFALAAMGITITLVVYQQLSLVLHADYGFDEEQLISIDLQGVPIATLRNELLHRAEVVDVAAVSGLPSAGGKIWTDIQADGMDEPMIIQFYAIDDHFMSQFNVRLLAGRDFAEVSPTNDGVEPVLITEKTVTALGFASPEAAIGQVVSFDNYPDPHSAMVLGVVSNFYTRGYDRGYQPVVLRYLPERYRHAVVRVRLGDVAGTLAALQATWKKVAPTTAFSYAFYDDQLAREYLFMNDIVKFFGVLTGFIILIAGLGLLGMASYTAETRTREVGIRKVMGADVTGVVMLLSRDYVRLVFIAVVVATPLAYVLANVLLQQFANRIELNVWYFMAGILPTLALALLTIGSQTLKAGLANPVDTLRQE